jgi:hypothetical protein
MTAAAATTTINATGQRLHSLFNIIFVLFGGTSAVAVEKIGTINSQ